MMQNRFKFWHNMSLTMQAVILALLLLGGSLGTLLAAKTAMAASLKSVSIINADVLTVGDIFDGVSHNADYVIGAAPQPGQDMTLNARTLYRIAVALDLPWRPNSMADQITIRREATIIPYSKIENTLRKELKNNGLTGNFNLDLSRGEPTIILSNDHPQTVEIESLNYDHQKDYFKATLVAPSRDNPVEKITINGSIERLVSIPVLRSTLQNGDIIGENDIKMIEVAEHAIQHDVMMNPQDMIGLTPRRMAHAGKFILNGTLSRPLLIKRGESVNITFQEGPLILSAKGKALQSGAKGDLVRVTNTNSSRTVDAIVTGDNQVIVQ